MSDLISRQEVLKLVDSGYLISNGNYQKDEIPLAFVGMWELRFLAHAFGIIDNDYYVAEKDGKVTYVTLHGLEKAAGDVRRMSEER